MGANFRVLFSILRYRLYEPFPWVTRWCFSGLAALTGLSWFRPITLPFPERLRDALIFNGPGWIKLGQLLSLRHDILPSDLCNTLSSLQDSVPGFQGATALLQQSWPSQALNQYLSFFEAHSIHAASLAQVHVGILTNGQKVAIKILRPGIEKSVAADSQALESWASWLEWAFDQCKQLRLKILSQEVKRILKNELDLCAEGANASVFKRQNIPQVYIPKIFWELSRPHILTMEYCEGMSIQEFKISPDYTHQHRLLAQKLVLLFLEQVFEHGFFHADLHPGNIRIKRHSFELELMDFGMVGHLSLSDRVYLAQNLAALWDRDYQKVALLHHQSGWISSTQSVDTFALSLQKIFEPLFEQKFKHFSPSALFIKLLEAACDHQIVVQPQLLLLQKALLHLESLLNELQNAPQIAWENAYIYLKKWIKKQVGPHALYKRIEQWYYANWHLYFQNNPAPVSTAPLNGSSFYFRLLHYLFNFFCAIVIFYMLKLCK